MAQLGRAQKPIDWKLVDRLLIAGADGSEVAPHFDLHPDSFYRRVEQEKGCSFTAYASAKRKEGNSLLHDKQYEKALKGNTQLLMHLGKYRLGQKDTFEDSVDPAIMKQFLDYMEFMKSRQKSDE